ncbi:MAG: hypothetical protein V3T17_15355 [Pseudomonadales bacterium]
MNERQRQAYMQAMGVDCYIPRLQLPGALASQPCQMPEWVEVLGERQACVAEVNASQVNASQANAANDVVAVSTDATPTAQKNASGSTAAMQALFNDEPKSTVVNTVANATAARVRKTQTAKQPIPRFALSMIRGGNILIIDDGLPSNIDPADYRCLIHNMLFALGAGKQQLSIDTFVWPMIRNSNIDQSETAVRQTLEAFLAKQIEQLDAHYVLVMGDIVARYLVDEVMPVGEFIQHPQWPVHLIRTLSAHRMLAQPELKREVWKDLQCLHRVLKKN